VRRRLKALIEDHREYTAKRRYLARREVEFRRFMKKGRKESGGRKKLGATFREGTNDCRKTGRNGINWLERSTKRNDQLNYGILGGHLRPGGLAYTGRLKKKHQHDRIG